MRIIIAHNFYQQAGGEDAVFRDETELLRNRGHEVLHFTRSNDSIERGSLTLAQQTIWNKTAAAELAAEVKRHRAEVVHFHNTFPLISPAAYYAARNAGASVVQTLHNYRLLCPNALFLRDGKPCESCLGKRVAWNAVVHRCYRESRAASGVLAAMLAFHRMRGTWASAVDRYIALSQFSRDKFLAGGLPAKKVMVLPNFMATDFGPGSGSGGYAVWVGRLSQEKGIVTLLESWKSLPLPISLRIIGDGPLATTVRSAAEGDSRICYLGRVATYKELTEAVGEASYLVLPSHCYEGCPKTLIESYCKATPVIASRLGALEEFVLDGETGWHFEPANPCDLAQTVARAFANPELMGLQREAARRHYEVTFQAEAHYRRLLDIYCTAIESYQRTKRTVRAA